MWVFGRRRGSDQPRCGRGDNPQSHTAEHGTAWTRKSPVSTKKQAKSLPGNAGTTPEDKISRLASSVSRLAKQVRPLAANDAFYGAFTTGSVAAFKAPAILNPRNFP